MIGRNITQRSVDSNIIGASVDVIKTTDVFDYFGELDSFKSLAELNRNKYDTVIDTFLIANNHAVWDRLTQISTDTEITYNNISTVKFSGVAPYSTLTFDETKDLSGHDYFEMILFVNDLTVAKVTAGAKLRFYDNSARTSNLIIYTELINNLSRVDTTPGIRKIRIPASEIIGTADMSDIFKILVSFESTGDGNVQFNLAEISAVSVEKAHVYIDFDDGEGTVYDTAFPIMSNLSLKGTCYINTYSIGTGDKMTISNLHTLNSIGWTIGSHSHTHTDLTTLTETQIENDIKKACRLLYSFGFRRGCYFFATPYGTSSQLIRKYANKYHITSRVNAGTKETASIMTSDYHINGFKEFSDSAAAITYLDSVIANKLSFHIIFHTIGGAGISVVEFEAIMNYLATKRDLGLVDIVTPEETFFET